MWAASLITSGAAAFGRVLLVLFLPSLTVVLTVLILGQAGAFHFDGTPGSLTDLVDLETTADTAGLLLLLTMTVLFAGVLQNFQIGMIRLLEGYWGRNSMALALAETASSFERRRLARLERRYARTPSQQDLLDARDPTQLLQQALPDQRLRYKRLHRERTAGLLAEQTVEAQFPPEIDAVLPTRLGNALRSFEHRAGDRYGYGTIPFWPRLYPHLSDRLSSAYHAAVDGVDAGVNFCYAFFLGALMTAIAFADTPQHLWVTAALLVVARVSYRSAVAAASLQGVMTMVSFDLHRFEMLGSMHLALPRTTDEEFDVARRLTDYLRDGNRAGDFKERFPNALLDHHEERR